MDTASLAFRALLRAVHEAEYSLPGPVLNIEALYVGDPQRYLAYPPPKDDPFTVDGVRDPALGNTGPLLFAEIEVVEVHAMPRRGPTCAEYSAKFTAVARSVAPIPGVRVNKDSIRLGRAAA